jgi:hypothetical protein
MATKTVVCPECGSAVAPGRYACDECGALLAAVAGAHRPRRTKAASADDAELGSAAEPGPAIEADPAPVVETASVGEPAVEASAAVWAPAAPGSEVAEPVVIGVSPEAVAEPVAGEEEEAESEPFDEHAPIAAARASRVPDVLHDMPAEARDETTDDDVADEAGDPGARVTNVESGTLPAAAPPADAMDSPAPAEPPAPSWPPAGDRGPIAAPVRRTPAGSYLPPSAVLPPLDGPAPAAAAPGLMSSGVALAAAVPAAGPSGSGVSAGDRIGRGADALSEALGSMRVTADASRRAVAVGAGLAAVGILLPWIGVFQGQNPLTAYFDRWGLAGPGVWLVLIALVALAAVAGSSGRPAAWPVGLPGVVMGAFLVGLTWRYVAGGFSFIGVWVVLVGAIVLAVAGGLEQRARHARGDASVHGSADAGLRSDP